jgi:hypothetical protein
MRTLLVPILLVFAACDPFSPDLGDAPFRCGADGECPDGYQCIIYSQAQRVCERLGGDPGDPDSGVPVQCNDDSQVEPNDTSPWVTPIPASRNDLTLIGLAICPTTDVDLYRFGIDVNGKNVRVTVTTEVAAGALSLQILRQNQVIGNGAVVSPTEIELSLGNLATDSYDVKIAAGAAGVQNNYSLEIVTCGPGSPGTTCP